MDKNNSFLTCNEAQIIGSIMNHGHLSAVAYECLRDKASVIVDYELSKEAKIFSLK